MNDELIEESEFVISDKSEFIGEEKEKIVKEEVEIEEFQPINVDFIEPSKEELQKAIDDIKIDLSLDEIKKDIIEEPITIKVEDIKKPKNGKTKLVKDNSVSADNLFEEFNSFLETKANISADTGIKNTIPTGIDVLDAILGGGFVIGALNMICGAPGSGKCLDYDEEIDIYVEE
jgi:TPP-dependent 2-oxoacid decarboxylase